MKGYPVLRIAITLLVMTAIFWPLCRVTRRSGEAADPAPNSKPGGAGATISSSLSATLLIHAAPSPLNCSISQHGAALLTEKDLIAPGEYRSSVKITKGEDLLVNAHWNNDDPHAVRVEVLIHGHQVPLEKSFWAQQSLEDTLPLPDSLLPEHHDDDNE
jgi:hypothetical protein